MTDTSAPLFNKSRLAACIVAAGIFLVPPALAQTRLPPPTAPVSADARQDRIEELERQLREAEARNEETQRQLFEAQREIRRLNGIVSELAGVNQDLATPPADAGAGAATPPAASGGSGGSAENTPSNLNQAQRAATGTLGTMPASAAPAPQPPALEPGPAYSRARELLVNGELAEAESAFADFLERYPQADTAADARFWFAFTQLARNNYRDAAANFTTYLRANQNGPRAAEAQVRLGMALVGMSEDGTNDAAERRQACAAFARLPANASRAVRDLAARESRAAQCT
jgi:TolA-binding protein